MRNDYYRTKKVNGYDSKTECKRALELKLLERAGEIRDLREQVTFELQPAFKNNQGKAVRKMDYIADFTYYDNKLKANVVEESKGFKTEKYRLKAKIFQFKYPELFFIESGLSKKKKR